VAEIREPGLGEAEAYAELLWQSFGLDQAFCEALVERHFPDRVRVFVDEGRVLGGLFADPQGQSWGGRVVPAVCIGGVAIDPTMRRRGVATRLLTAVLDEFRSAGTPLAVLHASNHALYRKLGFEHAGLRQVVSFHPRDLTGDPRACTVERVGPDGHAALKALYNSAVLPHRDGALLRSDLRWQRALALDRGGSAWCVATRDSRGHLTGYAAWTTDGRLPGLTARLGDVVATTAASAAALRGVLAQLEATVSSIHTAIAPDDPLWWHLQHPRATPVSTDAFLVRVLDPLRAVARWGFPNTTATASFTWSDPRFPQHDGAYTLRVRDGRGTLEPSRGGGPTLGPRGLTALLSGRVSPLQLPVLDLLDGAPSEAWARVFPRRTAYLRDMF